MLECAQQRASGEDERIRFELFAHQGVGVLLLEREEAVGDRDGGEEADVVPGAPGGFEGRGFVGAVRLIGPDAEDVAWLC